MATEQSLVVEPLQKKTVNGHQVEYTRRGLYVIPCLGVKAVEFLEVTDTGIRRYLCPGCKKEIEVVWP